jgi:hypothetical protein
LEYVVKTNIKFQNIVCSNMSEFGRNCEKNYISQTPILENLIFNQKSDFYFPVKKHCLFSDVNFLWKWGDEKNVPNKIKLIFNFFWERYENNFLWLSLLVLINFSYSDWERENKKFQYLYNVILSFFWAFCFR